VKTELNARRVRRHRRPEQADRYSSTPRLLPPRDGAAFARLIILFGGGRRFRVFFMPSARSRNILHDYRNIVVFVVVTTTRSTSVTHQGWLYNGRFPVRRDFQNGFFFPRTEIVSTIKRHYRPSDRDDQKINIFIYAREPVISRYILPTNIREKYNRSVKGDAISKFSATDKSR